MIPSSWLKEAQSRIAATIRTTPLTYDPEHELFIKWENQQVTGSFKLRGAVNKILSLQPWERERGIVAASAGNHGQGVALAARLTGAQVIVYASEHAVPAKIQAMQDLGAEVRLVPGGYGDAEKAGIEYAASSGATWVSPYNDGQIIAGQGTLALEVLTQHPDAAGYTWLVPAGGGGLLAGIGAALNAEPARKVQARLVGVQSIASPFLYHIFHSGTQDGVVELPSLADGLAGPVEEGSLTIPLIRKYCADFVLVTEEELRSGIRYAWQHYGERIEGSGAVTLAAALSGKAPARPAVAIITGGNIPTQLHQQIIGSVGIAVEVPGFGSAKAATPPSHSQIRKSSR
jgi:threonine dehydratase